MIKVIILSALFISLNVSAESGFYAEDGMSYHDVAAARPEVNMQTPLASFELGYQDESDWAVGFRHTSSIPQAEDGDGINELFISKRIWIK